MKLVSYWSDGTYKLGIVNEARVLDVFASQSALADNLAGLDLPQTIDEFYANGLAYLPALEQLLTLAQDRPGAWWLDESALDIAPIVPNPARILCIGLNYRRHAIESGMAIPENPVLFSKFNNAIAAANEVIPLPASAIQYDYEAELVVVMGRIADNVAEADALDYVLGYCIGNDLSARDLQFLTNQWLLGKTLDKFLPIGPYLVTDIADPQTLQMKTWYNGELRQNSNTQDMIFSVAEIISHLSRYFPLHPGDIIATGTPEGVILGGNNPQWMKKGDTVVIEIDGLGRLENQMG